MHRLSLRLLIAALMVFFAAPASAQYTKDAAAQKKIDEAINEHYLATDFQKAEDVLLGTINACGPKCSPATIAKAWMYVGVVRGVGKQDQAGAKEAFSKAVAADKNVQPDQALMTPEITKLFNDVKGAAGGSTAPPPPGGGTSGGTGAVAPPSGPPPVGGMECVPSVREVQTRRPIPFACRTSAPATGATLFYKEFGASGFSSVKMKSAAGWYTGEIPCSATGTPGTLKVYVIAADQSGSPVDSLGSSQAPVEFTLGENVSAEPPSLPGQAAPARCAETGASCPPGFPCEGKKAACGNKDWGAACQSSAECKCGLLCADGTCESAPSCESDKDCSGTTGYCDKDSGKCAPGTSEVAVGPYKKLWVGLHVAKDITFIGGSDVCVKQVQESKNFQCFYSQSTASHAAGERYVGEPYPGAGIATGIAPATTRVLGSFDYAINPRMMIGGRIGFAFGGGPPAQAGKPGFMPIHFEPRFTYWFRPLTEKGLRPYAHVSAGLAQVDAKVKVNVRECLAFGSDQSPGPLGSPSLTVPNYTPGAKDGPTTRFNDCVSGNSALRDFIDSSTGAANSDLNSLAPQLDVWKKLGQGFGSVGGGLMYAFTANMGLQLNVNIMVMAPSFGLVFEPSLGFEMGL